MPRAHSILALIVPAILLAPGTARAAPLSESEFLAAAAERSAVSEILDSPVTSARAEARRAAAWSNPAAGFEHEAPGGDRELSTWSLSWSPPLDTRRALRRAAADAAVDAAIRYREWSAVELRAELRAIYADWALAAERVAIAEDLLTRTKRVITTVDEKAKHGEASGLVADRLHLAAIELETQVARAGADLALSASAARGWLQGEARVEPLLPALPGALEDDDLTEHPVLAAMRLEAQQAEFLERSSSRLLTFPELTIGLMRTREPGFESEGLTIGGTLPLPVFDRRQGDRLEARGRLAAAKARLELETTQRTSQMEGAQAAYVRLREAALSAATAVQASGRVVEATAARFEMGESDVTELLETLRAVLAARVASLDLYGAALEAHRELELAAGRPLIPTEEERR